MTMRILLAVLAAGALAGTGCRSAEGPVAGELVVQLATPNADDRAVLFRLVGPRTSVTAPGGTGYRVLVAPLLGDTAKVLVIAPAGGRLAAGDLVRVLVPDTRQIAAYSANPLELATTAYASRAASGYTLTFVKP